MNKIEIFQVDAFTDNLFQGNPAAICLLDEWLSDYVMQSIGNENNLADTAFLVPKGDDFEIRWFTPSIEVDLCGHATLASAFVLFNLKNYSKSEIKFISPRSGLLTVSRENDLLFLNFPADNLELANQEIEFMEQCIGVRPVEVYKGKTDYIAVINTEKELRELRPAIDKISQLDARGLIVTAEGDKLDFVSRFFAPQSGIDEDPVTGSAHTSLTPLWSQKLGKDKLTAAQLSKRGGQLLCELKGDRCVIGGKAKLYMTGEITIG